MSVIMYMYFFESQMQFVKTCGKNPIDSMMF